MQVRQCNQCGNDIIFLITANNKRMPVDARNVEEGQTQWNKATHGSHFDTCPARQQSEEERRR